MDTIKAMVTQAQEEASRQDRPCTPMQWHLDLWLEEADEYGPADHRAMIAVAQEIVKLEEEPVEEGS